MGAAWSGLVCTPVRIRPRRKEVTVPLPWRTPEVADTVFSTPDDGCMTPVTCRVTWLRINVYIQLHRVGPLLTLNHDARNHVFKKKKSQTSCCIITTSCIGMCHIPCSGLSDCDSFIFWSYPKNKAEARHPQNMVAMKLRIGEGIYLAPRDLVCKCSPKVRGLFTQGRRYIERHHV